MGDEGEWWRLLLASLISIFGSGGFVSWYAARQSRSARISGDERVARRDAADDRSDLLTRMTAERDRLFEQCERLAREKKALEDYAHHLRTLVTPPPPPWPPAS